MMSQKNTQYNLFSFSIFRAQLALLVPQDSLVALELR